MELTEMFLDDSVRNDAASPSIPRQDQTGFQFVAHFVLSQLLGWDQNVALILPAKLLGQVIGAEIGQSRNCILKH